MRRVIVPALMTVLAVSGISLHVNAADQKDPSALFEETCSQCHTSNVPKAERMSKNDWADIVSRMRSNGLSISDQEASVIIEYLAANYGKKNHN